MDITKSLIYEERLSIKEEVNKHKWIESEKLGYDIGFVKALINWTVNYKTEWAKKRNLPR